MRTLEQRAKHIKWMRRYRKTHKKQFLIYEKRRNKKKRGIWRRGHNLSKKIKTLTRYGKHGKLQCCWPGCIETDVDVLTLDHVKDDGAKHRKQANGTNGGNSLYSLLANQKRVKGFQTLCWNHQWKKQIVRLRKWGRKKCR